MGPPVFFWVMLGAMPAAFAWAIAAASRRRPAMAVFGAVLGLVIGIAILYFANTGAFCVAPLGSACA